jgi:hypothetical protein
MNLLDAARRDVKTINSNGNDFAVDITFTTPDDAITVTVKGRYVRRYVPVDTEAGTVNSRVTAISFSESTLTDASYPVRTDGEVDLRRHKISFTDITDTVKNFYAAEIQADETTGLITVILNEADS